MNQTLNELNNSDSQIKVIGNSRNSNGTNFKNYHFYRLDGTEMNLLSIEHELKNGMFITIYGENSNILEKFLTDLLVGIYCPVNLKSLSILTNRISVTRFAPK